MNDETTPVFSIPCLECGSLPEAAWEDSDIRVQCSNPKCFLSIIAVLHENWPITKANAKKHAVWPEE